MSNERFREALDYFRSVGYSQAQSAGIVGNLSVESNFDTKAVGDNGTAFGIAQWRGKRVADFKKVFGKDIKDATFQEQLQFVQWELQNTEKAAGQALLKTTNIQDATKVFMEQYERPNKNPNINHINRRLQDAGKAYNIGWSGNAGNPFSDTINKVIGQVLGSNPTAAAGVGVANAVAGATGETLDTFGKVLSYIPRAVAILLGIALIIIALVVLLGDKIEIPIIPNIVK